MEDALIVDLYWARDEQALAETAAKFGTYCRKIADNILHSAHDAEECENDTWLAAWNSMPTNRPARLAPYLGRITRNLALDRFDKASAQKRGSGQTCAPLDELADRMRRLVHPSMQDDFFNQFRRQNLLFLYDSGTYSVREPYLFLLEGKGYV